MNFIKHYFNFPFRRKFLPLLVSPLISAAFAATADVQIHEVSSENPVPKRDAANMTNGNGLDGQMHAVGEDGIAWTSRGVFPPTDFDPFVTFDLGRITKVDSIRIWNYNSGAEVTIPDADGAELSTTKTTLAVFGPDEIELFTSADGVKYESKGTIRLDMAPGKGDYAGQLFEVNFSGVRYVKFDIKSTHEGTVFDGTGKNNGKIDKRALTGLSEVQFQVPSLVEYQVDESKMKATEGGEGTRYSVRLLEKVAAGKTTKIHVIPADRSLTLGTAEPGLEQVLEFDENNWDQWQAVDVKATDDGIFTVRHRAKISHFIEQDGPAGRLEKEVTVQLTDNDPRPAPEKLEPVKPSERMDWFADQKYYLFLHWGPSSLAGTEISWSRGSVGVEKYDALYKKFNPVDFDADELVKLAQDAGLRTIVLITKHHDGFCMWDTKTTDYNIMNTPFKRDVTRELADACKRHGMRFSLYYSIMDWYQPDWPIHYAGGPGYELPEGTKPDINRYFKYMHDQLTELLTNYGDISLMWWDGTDGRDAFAPLAVWGDKESTELEKLCRKLQPAMVMNNRVGHWDGNDISRNWWVDRFGDYDSNEMERMVYQEKPWEYTWTLGNQWAYRPNDSYKSTETMLRHYLIRIAGANGNFLMNVGPGPSGAYEPLVVDRITDIGNWLKFHGESIYETRGGPFIPGDSKWGVSTRKGNKIYLHILNWPDDSLVLPPLGKKIVKSTLLTGGLCEVSQTDDSVTISVPNVYRKKIDTIVVLELDGDASDIEPIQTK